MNWLHACQNTIVSCLLVCHKIAWGLNIELMIIPGLIEYYGRGTKTDGHTHINLRRDATIESRKRLNSSRSGWHALEIRTKKVTGEIKYSGLVVVRRH